MACLFSINRKLEMDRQAFNPAVLNLWITIPISKTIYITIHHSSEIINYAVEMKRILWLGSQQHEELLLKGYSVRKVVENH